MKRKSFANLNSRYDVKKSAAADENLFRWTLFEIQYESTVEPKKITHVFHVNTLQIWRISDICLHNFHYVNTQIWHYLPINGTVKVIYLQLDCETDTKR